mmetsp:Transcript_52824/g.148199  ORF Transcript_52824/g.148199 Transcript_52824/m.148199 type:complete len:90 (+) Transcript_52824:115-384(+)
MQKQQQQQQRLINMVSRVSTMAATGWIWKIVTGHLRVSKTSVRDAAKTRTAKSNRVPAVVRPIGPAPIIRIMMFVLSERVVLVPPLLGN